LPKEGENAEKAEDGEEEEKAGDSFSGDASAFVAKFTEKVNDMINDKDLV